VTARTSSTSASLREICEISHKKEHERLFREKFIDQTRVQKSFV